MSVNMTVLGGATIGTLFTFFMTVLGAGVVFLFKEKCMEKIENVFLGFAGGVMMAALVWSLLIPAMEEAVLQNQVAWLVCVIGFFAGGLLLYGLDCLLTKLQARSSMSREKNENKVRFGKDTLLFVLAVTLHNVPEGMAVGMAFAMAGMEGNLQTVASAIALAIGIGIQNLPEGAAIALPLRREGVSKSKAFMVGGLTGVVEPIFGIFTVLVAGKLVAFMPLLLSVAAGAMFYVVVEELIPKTANYKSKSGTWGLFIGFAFMMILDVALS